MSAGRVVSPILPEAPGTPQGKGLRLERLHVEGLTVALGRGVEQVTLLHGLDFSVFGGQVLAVVGESGSGKTLLMRALLGLLPAGPGIVRGRIDLHLADSPPVCLLEGLDSQVSRDPSRVSRETQEAAWQVSPAFQTLHRQRMQRYWGALFAWVSQHPLRALDPTLRVEKAVAEAIRARVGTPMSEALVQEEVFAWLYRLNFDQPKQTARLYPAELSGGMAQRVLLAVALARGARVLIADEPTSGLDAASVTGLCKVLEGLRQAGLLESLILVTHDLGLAARLADRVLLLQRGRGVEWVAASDFFRTPGPQSEAGIRLLSEYRRLEQGRAGPGPTRSDDYRLELVGVSRGFSWRRTSSFREGLSFLTGRTPAQRQEVLTDVALQLRPGERLGLMGPSGIGKSTLARCILGDLRPERGQVLVDGVPLLSLPSGGHRARWRKVQPLYQQVDSTLHPGQSVFDGLWETARILLQLPAPEARRRVWEVLERVGLQHRAERGPKSLSGGEMRRVGIARVLLVRPAVVIADEPTAGIDASLRAEILDLLLGLCRGDDPAAMLLISHDRQAVAYACDRCVTLEQGRLVPLTLEPGSNGEEPI